MFAKLNPELTTWGEILHKYQHLTIKRETKEKNNDEETINQLFKGFKKLSKLVERVIFRKIGPKDCPTCQATRNDEKSCR